MEKIDLDLDNENEMMFRVEIQGTKPGQPLCRLMIEGEEITHTVTGDFLPNNEVAILIPPMKGMINEGTYDSYLEVLVDDRVFIPLEMKINFEESVKVVAETITKRAKPKVKATASILSSNKKQVPVEKVKKENIDKPSSHPAKKRRDQKLAEAKKSTNNKNTYTEKDIMNLVRKIRSKTK